MKLIYAIVNRDDKSIVSAELTKEGFFATKLASTGGFLKSGNTTFLICTEDDLVEKAIGIIAKFSKKRSQISPSSLTYGAMSIPYTGLPMEVTVGGATIFVTNIEKFEKY